MSADPVHLVVVGQHPWNREAFDRLEPGPGEVWHYLDHPAELTRQTLAAWQPRYVFFLHWSHHVPPEITDPFECVCFHMTDVPYGRGGSPLQNLILRGHRTTRLSALRMVQAFDAGPVYLKRDLDLSGPAGEIYRRATSLSLDMAREIARNQPTPVPQEGSAVVFARRRPEQSRIPPGLSLEALYDFIRMLDAEGYPHAFIEEAGRRLEFTQATLHPDRVEAKVTLRLHASPERAP